MWIVANTNHRSNWIWAKAKHCANESRSRLNLKVVSLNRFGNQFRWLCKALSRLASIFFKSWFAWYKSSQLAKAPGANVVKKLWKLIDDSNTSALDTFVPCKVKNKINDFLMKTRKSNHLTTARNLRIKKILPSRFESDWLIYYETWKVSRWFSSFLSLLRN